ncbi:tRNA (adenine(58)-N(1))-methyltransferase catalytic subunit TRM61, putative [Plasmodium vivax]|uniref:tRNA (adenine(58)-N(1))-methyltransferase n=1 Tax=Plasmodium vivax TaxID=5855 RepID=A0A1G4H4N2_PLAVI|nr:tRNA (adenine(58)-N(1))-methyltransferase catalytic subunit TRM61, putative [Plasmodium vivax]
MLVKENHSVILYADEENVELVKLTSDGVLTNRKGTFLHKNIIGKKYGSKIYDSACRNYIYVLRRTPEFVAISLKKKTQTLYEHDISFICLLCNALPNKKIIEAGTGTGCLTYALASCVLPKGVIHTFEYNEERYEEVRNEFSNFENVKNNIKFHHKDVISDSFVEFQPGEIDSVFLDMPNPWLCVPHVKKVLKERGVFVIFLPCIEQVYKIIEALEENQFCEIVTYELVNKSWEIIRNGGPAGGCKRARQFSLGGAKETSDPLEGVKETGDPLEGVKETGGPLERAKQSSDPLERAKQSSDPLERAKQSNDPLERAKQSSDPLERAKQSSDPSNEQKNCPTPAQSQNPTYRLRQKENKTHTGYLIFSKKELSDEHEQIEIELKGV